MSYALFSQRKLVLTGELNNLQLQQMQRSDEQYNLATQTSNLQQQLTSMNASQSNSLAAEYQKLAEADDENDRASINAQIKSMEQGYQSEIDAINRDIYQVSIKENALEMEVKRLDTMVTTVQKQLEAVEEAESSGIDRATPKYNGLG